MSQTSTKFIANSAVTAAKLANMPANTVKGNNTGSSATPIDLTVSQTQSLLSVPTASSPLAIGSGGTGQTSASTGFNALSPMTTLGDVIVGGASGAGARLPIGTNGQFLGADSTATNGISWQNPIDNQNLLINGAFDFWTANNNGISVTATGGGTPTATYGYGADQWYINNILGGGTIEGIINFSRATGVTNGSRFGASVQITTAPTGTGIQNGCELYQVLSNKASFPLYNKTASFTVLVKGFNNVNQVGIQFFYATTETKLTTAIGSEVLTTVNASTFTACTINGQALGTAQTTSGVVGVRIRITGVSTGQTYNLNNGFVCEQAMMNLGPVAMPFSRKYQDPAMELAACQYFYEKSYDLVTDPGTATNNGCLKYITSAATTASTNALTPGHSFSYKVSKRIVPTVTLYSRSTGTTGKVFDVSNSFVFIVTAANATAGATYLNNSQTFTVVNTISGGTTLTTVGTGTPSTSGTLTRNSGTGDNAIVFTSFTVAGSDVNASVQNGGMNNQSFSVTANSGDGLDVHWTADARI